MRFIEIDYIADHITQVNIEHIQTIEGGGSQSKITTASGSEYYINQNAQQIHDDLRELQFHHITVKDAPGRDTFVNLAMIQTIEPLTFDDDIMPLLDKPETARHQLEYRTALTLKSGQVVLDSRSPAEAQRSIMISSRINRKDS